MPDNIPTTTCSAVLCRYDEIALKGGNRMRFENQLIANIKKVLTPAVNLHLIRVRGRILFRFDELPEPTITAAVAKLKKVFGLASFSPGCLIESSLEMIEQTALSHFQHTYSQLSTTDRGSISFRIRVRRSDKQFPFSSNDMEIKIADQILKNYPNLNVNLRNADITTGVEIRKEWTFVFSEKIQGPGGLPSGSNNGALALLSGGIDSPVACYMVMKRGCPLHFLTFHSYPYIPGESVDKVARIVNVLNSYQLNGRLYACNLAESQKVIRDNCTAKFRTILYRRLMMKIATNLAESLNLNAIVTGESIGQVASQTMANLNSINHVTDLLVLRPLVGMDKVEIIEKAKRVGTYTLSQENCPDSCTVFAPNRPATTSQITRLEQEESKTNPQDLLTGSMANIKQISV